MSSLSETLERSPSKNLRRYWQSQLWAQSFMLVVSFVFCIIAAITSDYVVSPDTYGGLITGVKAEVWTYPFLVSSIIYIFGIFINGNWRWSPFLRLTGSFIQLVGLFLFGVLSFISSPIDIFTVLCFPFVLFLFWCTCLNIGDAKRAVLRGRHDIKFRS